MAMEHHEQGHKDRSGVHGVTGPKKEVTVRRVEEQGEWESRALWYKVAKGIRESDFETAAREEPHRGAYLPHTGFDFRRLL